MKIFSTEPEKGPISVTEEKDSHALGVSQDRLQNTFKIVSTSFSVPAWSFSAFSNYGALLFSLRLYIVFFPPMFRSMLWQRNLCLKTSQDTARCWQRSLQVYTSCPVLIQRSPSAERGVLKQERSSRNDAKSNYLENIWFAFSLANSES